jgi:hypothetical protein
MPQCLVLPGIYGLFVQALLFACCAGILYMKKKREDAKMGQWARTNLEFVLDSAKQFSGCAWLHVLNLMFASLQDAMLQGDQCSWYWINIMVDTTLGTAVEYFLLQVATAVIKKRGSTDFQTGEYKVEDGQVVMSNFVKQLTVWLIIVSCMKIMMGIVMFLFSGPLLAIAGFVLHPFVQAPALKLLVVMIFFPIIMDGFQLWVTDNFIKKRTHSPVQGDAKDEEVGNNYAEASADVLITLSERCEQVTGETLQSLTTQIKTKCKEVLKVDANEVAFQREKDEGTFETQFNFKTRIPEE